MRKLIYSEKTLSISKDISIRINIGPPTRKSDNGSGGDIKAPRNKETNHTIDLFSVINCLLTNPIFNDRTSNMGI